MQTTPVNERREIERCTGENQKEILSCRDGNVSFRILRGKSKSSTYRTVQWKLLSPLTRRRSGLISSSFPRSPRNQ